MSKSQRQNSCGCQAAAESPHAKLGLFDRFLDVLEKFVDRDPTRALIGRSWQ